MLADGAVVSLGDEGAGMTAFDMRIEAVLPADSDYTSWSGALDIDASDFDHVAASLHYTNRTKFTFNLNTANLPSPIRIYIPLEPEVMSSDSEGGSVASIGLDPEGYFEGLSKQSMKFHNALAELIDNSISANIDVDDYFDQSNPEQSFRVQITIDRYQDHIKAIVADSGRGIASEAFENTVLQQGNRSHANGILNEHGMGLKNALAVLTRNEGNEPFKILSKAPADPDLENSEYVRISGPFREGIPIEQDDEADEWGEGAGALEDLEKGTRFHFLTTHDMVRSSWRSAKRLGSIIPGIQEHLGVMYREFLTHSDSNHIHLYWEDHVRGDSGQVQIQPIWPEFKNGEDADGRSWYEEDEIEVDDENGTTFLVQYKRGIVDWQATRERYEK
jgi:hypothetical protein